MEQQGRSILLREFIREVIKKIPVKQEWIESNYLVSLPRRANIVEPIKEEIKQPVLNKTPQIIKRTLSPQPLPHKLMNKFSPKPTLSSPVQRVPIKAPVQAPAPVPIPTQDSSNTSIDQVLPKSGSKLWSILQDPLVIGLECPGADKNILINRAGRIQPVQIILKEEEIKAVLDEISQETRIPLISGIFKTVYKSIMITAVISEFVGSRFIIEKRPKNTSQVNKK